MLIYGIHTVLARIQEHPQTINQVYILTSNNPKLADISALAQKQKVICQFLSKEKFVKLIGNNLTHQGVVCDCKNLAPEYLSVEDFLQNNEDVPLQLLILDQVHDPHNLGACLRSCSAFGASAIIIPKDRSASLTEAVAKAAVGAAETIPLITVTNLARALDQIADSYIETVGLAMDGDLSLWEYGQKKLGKRVAWVLGGEENGMRRLTRERCQFVVKIPMVGTVESLNVSVSAALCLAEYSRKYN